MFCAYCGKEIDDDSRFCVYCGAPVPPEAPVQEAAPAAAQTQPAAPQTPTERAAGQPVQAPPVQPGSPYPQPAQPYAGGAQDPASVYDAAVKNAKVCLIASVAVLAVGVICALLVSPYLGAALCVAAELAAVLPRTKFQKAFRRANAAIKDKKELKRLEKEAEKPVKQRNKAYSYCVPAAAALAVLICAFVVPGLPLTFGAQKGKTTTGDKWETLYPDAYFEGIQSYFESDLRENLEWHQDNTHRYSFTLKSDKGEALCEGYGSFGSALGKGEESLELRYTDTDAFTDGTSKLSGAVAFCSTFAAPYIAGLTGESLTAVDMAQTFQSKIVAGEYSEISKGQGGIALKVTVKGIPVIFGLYNDYNALMCIGSSEIGRIEKLWGLAADSSASGGNGSGTQETQPATEQTANAYSDAEVRSRVIAILNKTPLHEYSSITIGQMVPRIFTHYELTTKQVSSGVYDVEISGTYTPMSDTPYYQLEGSVVYRVDIERGECTVLQDYDSIHRLMTVRVFE